MNGSDCQFNGVGYNSGTGIITITPVSGGKASGSFTGRRYSGTFTNIKYIP